MGLQFKSDSVATPPAGVVLQKLYRDATLTPYDVFAFDALDPYSWPKQAAPAAGDTIGDISPAAGAPATFGDPADLSFNGGFRFADNNNPQILLPTQCKPAPTSKGYIAMCWLSLGAVNGTTKLFGWMTSGNYAYGCYRDGSAPHRLVVFADGASATVNGSRDGLFLFGVGRVPDGAGGFQYRHRVYDTSGVITSGGGASGANAAQSTGGCGIGEDGSFAYPGNAFEGFRFRFLDTGTVGGLTAASFDALCDAEFATNKARADWSIT